MLQDLDARANAAGEASDLIAKPAAARDARPSRVKLAAGALGIVVVAAGSVLAWRYWHRPALAPAPQIMLAKRASAPVPAPVAAPVPAPVAAPVAQPAEPAAPAAGAPASARPKARVERPAKPAHAAKPAARTSAKDGNRRTARPAAKGAAPAKTVTISRPAPPPAADTAVQRADAAYRRALERLREGWVTEAMAEMEQALQANPRHDAARQTLVRLLMENGRTDDAMRQLQTALAADPRQPALAMLLARLQIERGGSGIETLTRTLPYASGNGDYHAFLAGALQRQGRNHEAAAQYQAALRSAPQNGVWWMGLGISLQADKRDGEALDAFQRAKANGVSQELQSFVDRKIQQLSR